MKKHLILTFFVLTSISGLALPVLGNPGKQFHGSLDADARHQIKERLSQQNKKQRRNRKRSSRSGDTPEVKFKAANTSTEHKRVKSTKVRQKHQASRGETKRNHNNRRSHDVNRHKSNRSDHVRNHRNKDRKHRVSSNHNRSDKRIHRVKKYRKSDKRHAVRHHKRSTKHHVASSKHRRAKKHHNSRWAFGAFSHHNSRPIYGRHVEYGSYIHHPRDSVDGRHWYKADDFRTRKGKSVERRINVDDYATSLEIEGTGRAMYIDRVYIEFDNGRTRRAPELEGYYEKGDYRIINFEHQRYLRRIFVDISPAQYKRGYGRINYRRH